MKIKSELILIVTGIVLTLVSSSVISAYAAAGLKVFVNLQHNGGGSARVCVSSFNENLGCKNVSLSSSNPAKVGPWEFGPSVVSVGDSFTVCVTNLGSGQQNCKAGSNSPKKAPEYVSVTVPGKSPPVPSQSAGFSTSNSGSSNLVHFHFQKIGVLGNSVIVLMTGNDGGEQQWRLMLVPLIGNEVVRELNKNVFHNGEKVTACVKDVGNGKPATQSCDLGTVSFNSGTDFYLTIPN